MTSSDHPSDRAIRGAKRASIVYWAKRVGSDDFYIGVTMCSLLKRRREHLHAAREGATTHFYNAIRKYGEDQFEFSVLEECVDYATALRRERELIAEKGPRYNISAGGEGNLGYRPPRELIERLAAQRRGKPSPQRGRKRSAEFCKRLSDIKRNRPTRYWLGKKRSPETIEKIRSQKIGKKRKEPSPEILEIFKNNMRRAAFARRRPVICLSDGLVFPCAKDAAESYGLKTLSISKVCANPIKRKSVHGLEFRYVNQ